MYSIPYTVGGPHRKTTQDRIWKKDIETFKHPSLYTLEYLLTKEIYQGKAGNRKQDPFVQ